MAAATRFCHVQVTGRKNLEERRFAVPVAGYLVTRSCERGSRVPGRQEAEMAENDVLSQMLHAWRDDIESEPFPQFSELLIPRQQTRARVCAAAPSVARVTNATQGTDV
jgi:hypothetical protein